MSWPHFFLSYLALLLLAALLMMLANLSLINNLLFPIEQYLAIAGLMWDESPLGTLQFLSHKSLFALAHTDARTGLHIWTLEFDLITLLFYAVAVAIFVRNRGQQGRFFAAPSAADYWLWAALASLILAFSYVTHIAHCAGPTWIGFVLLYGLGVGELDQDRWPQAALLLLALALFLRHKKMPR